MQKAMPAAARIARWLAAFAAGLLLLAVSAAPAAAQHDSWPGEGADPAAEVVSEGGDEASGDAGVEDEYDEVLPADVEVSWDPTPREPRPDRPVPTPIAELPLARGKTIPGRTARMRADGKAAVPLGAPRRVRDVVRALNEIAGKPYKWGGGHGSIIDRGYDCSGAVSYGLIRNRLLSSPMVSGRLAHWGSAGAGRWISVYANNGHVYMEVAGLRLDTSPVGDPTRRKGVRWRPAIGRRGGFAARHPAGL